MGKLEYFKNDLEHSEKGVEDSIGKFEYFKNGLEQSERGV
jgi:hypothetical protein